MRHLLFLALLPLLLLLLPAANDYRYYRFVCSVIYVSSVSANGISVGDDATGRCNDVTAPLLTVDAASAYVVSGGEIRINGTSQVSPTTYVVGTAGNWTVPYKIVSAVPGQLIAKLTTASSTRIFSINPASVGTFALTDLLLDGTSTAADIIQLQSYASTYTVELTNVVTQNHASGYAVSAPSAAFMGNVTGTGLVMSGGTVNGCFYIPAISAGAINIDTTSSCILTAQNLASAGGGFHVIATASQGANVSATMRGSVNMGLVAGGSGVHYANRAVGIPGALMGGTSGSPASYTCSGGAGGTRRCQLLGITYNSGNLPNNSVLAYATVADTTGHAGSVGAGSSDDNANLGLNKMTGVSIHHITVTSADHGVFLANCNGCTSGPNNIAGAGLGELQKWCDNCTSDGSTIGTTNIPVEMKGATNFTASNMAITITAASGGAPIALYSEDDSATYFSSGNFTSNTVTINSSTGSAWFTVTEVGSTANYTSNNYIFNGGSLNGGKYNNVTYPSLATWRAGVAPGASSDTGSGW